MELPLRKAIKVKRDPAGKQDPFFSPHLGICALLCVIALCGAAYYPGLNGPLLLDDEANLLIIKQWAYGQVDLPTALFANSSGPGGRIISMASFLLSTAIGGYNTLSLKLTNLLLHLLNGCLVYVLFVRLAKRDGWLRSAPQTAAVFATALWLLHPLLVSTTLYAVQRMTILSATFTLLGILSYLHGRQALEWNHRSGSVWLLLVTPLLTVAAFLSKENGLLTPFLCLVIEFTYFRTRLRPRPLAVNWFAGLTVLAPIVALAAISLTMPERLFSGFENRPFTLYERVLTQSRVLFDYLSSILVPQGPTLSIFTDDYPKSEGLFSPISSFFSLVGWLLIVASAIAVRKAFPAITAGVGIFLTGHLMESSIFPLLLYFEHRNYVPAIGAIWALTGLLAPLAAAFQSYSRKSTWILIVAATALIAVLWASTNARSRIWATEATLFASSEIHHPTSAWLRMSQAQHFLTASPPRVDLARSALSELRKSPDSSTRQIGLIGVAAVDCHATGSVKPETLPTLFAFGGRPIQADLSRIIRTLAEVVRSRDCEHLSPHGLATELGQWLDNSDLPEQYGAKSRLRYETALLFGHAGDFHASLRHANIAWKAGRRDLPLAALRAGALAGVGCPQKARAEFSRLRKRSDASGRLAGEFLDAYEAQLPTSATDAESCDARML